MLLDAYAVAFLLIGLCIVAATLPAALLAGWPSLVRVKILAPSGQTPPECAEAAAWLGRQGFRRLGALKRAPALPMLFAAEEIIEVFVNEEDGVYAHLGRPRGPGADSPLLFQSCCEDGDVITTVATPRGTGEPEGATRLLAWQVHAARVAVAVEGHGPVRAPADLEEARRIDRLTAAGLDKPVQNRNRFLLLLIPTTTGAAVAAAAFVRPFPFSTVASAALFFFATCFVLTNIPGTLLNFSPWRKVVKVGEPRAQVPKTVAAARLELEALGFRLFGTQTEGAPLAGQDAEQMDVFVHEQARTWASICESVDRGVLGYFLTTYPDGAVILIWTDPLVTQSTDRLHLGGGQGWRGAWADQQKAVAGFTSNHGEPDRCQAKKDRVRAAHRYYRATGAMPRPENRRAWRFLVFGVVLGAVASAIALMR
jgi:hypothetical protein